MNSARTELPSGPSYQSAYEVIEHKAMEQTRVLHHFFRRAYTLNLKCIRSPSFTTYSFPSTAIFPASLTAASEPYFTKSS